MRILFDQATPVPIRAYLGPHTIRTASQEGWSTLSNGDLLRVAEAAGFDVFLTTDKNLRYQQNLNSRLSKVNISTSCRWNQRRRQHPESAWSAR
jgi:hypothetical protein